MHKAKRERLQLSSKPVGLVSCLWLARTVPMASGHELTFNAIVINIVNLASPIMAIDAGMRTSLYSRLYIFNLTSCFNY